MEEFFHFKRFSLRNSSSTMKVNTDGVLLGALCSLKGGRVLDAGTGGGLVALMLAQRLSDAGKDFHIDGVDIDSPSIEEALFNFGNSPWKDSLTAVKGSVLELDGTWDQIVSNPPFFLGDLKNPDSRKASSRHGDILPGRTLSYESLVLFSKDHLSDGGTLSVILPSECEAPLLRLSRLASLEPFRITRLRTVSRKPPRRVVVQLRKTEARLSPLEDEIIIQEEGAYTREYTSLVKDFYLWA